MSKNKLATVNKEMAEVPAQNISPLIILQQAVASGANPENVRMMMDMAKEWEDREAKKAYVKAMTAFKLDPPNVYKTAHVSYEAKGFTTDYRHAELANACEILGHWSAVTMISTCVAETVSVWFTHRRCRCISTMFSPSSSRARRSRASPRASTSRRRRNGAPRPAPTPTSTSTWA